MSIKAVSFDVGGTLIHVGIPEDKAIMQAITYLGLPEPHEDLAAMVPKMYREVYDKECSRNPRFWASKDGSVRIWFLMYEWLACEIGLSEYKEQIAKYTYEVYKNSHSWKLYDDCIPALEELKRRGLKLAVTSNWDITLPSILKGIGIANYFDVITASAVIETRKPEPQIFQHTLNNLCFKPQEVLHVGDCEDPDGNGPTSIGMPCVIIDRGNEALTHKFAEITALSDLPSYIDMLSNK